MAREGGCHCGAVRYAVEGEPVYHALCHCDACRASSGAPAVAWFCVQEGQLVGVTGTTQEYEGRPGAKRQFCGRCGTGLFYRNAETLPGLVDIQSATFDEPSEAVPMIQVQCAEQLPWMSGLAEIPAFERYPAPTP